MTLKEIRDSGLLELYAIGTADVQERRLVEQALTDHPELLNDLKQISETLLGYASAHAIEPSPGLKDKILKDAGGIKVDTLDKNARSNKIWPGLAGVLALLCLWLGYLFNAQQNTSNLLSVQYENLVQQCDSLRIQRDMQFASLESLTDPDNDILIVSATPKYASTQLYFYHNNIDKKNFIQIKNLPTIDNASQSFQLWSLKGSDAPIPLDVFQSDGNDLVEVSHIEDTDVYAITIEPKGGSQSPTLDDLIGTFSVAG